MELILVRHGEPVTAQSDHGPVDPELSGRGLWQAERLGAWLACEPIDHVVVTPKRRAIETAAPLCKLLGREPEVIDDLVEIDRAARFYAPTEVLHERFPEYWALVLQGKWDELGWDPPEVFRDRVLAAWNDLVARRPGERVMVSCHGGTIGVITGALLGLQNHHATLGVTPYASCTRIVVSDGTQQLRSLHEVGHFDAARERAIGPDGEGFPPP